VFTEGSAVAREIANDEIRMTKNCTARTRDFVIIPEILRFAQNDKVKEVT